jgi:hypothetical protein
MTPFTKLVALALFASSAAIISSASPSSAQAGAPQYQGSAKPPCCQPISKKIVTGMPGWLVKPPGGLNFSPAATISQPNSAWSTVPGSSWISAKPTAGQNEPGGTYVFEYDLGCLCGNPPGIDKTPVTLNVIAYGDDDVTIKLNGTQIAQHTGGYGFTGAGTSASIASIIFQPQCENVLTFEVPNWDGGPGAPGSPGGLDASITVSGYFMDVPPGQKCPACRSAATPVRADKFIRGH